MTATMHERRRNAYPANCCVCLAEVPAEAGWLYADTKARPRRSTGSMYGRFPKKVKCDRCHRENVTSKWQAANLDNPRPPAPRPWTAPQVRRWTLEIETEATHELIWPDPMAPSVRRPITLVHVHVTIGDERVKLAGGDPIGNGQCGPWYGLEEQGIGGKPFSPAAWALLKERVRAAIDGNAK
jgi:hypothetical protein